MIAGRVAGCGECFDLAQERADDVDQTGKDDASEVHAFALRNGLQRTPRNVPSIARAHGLYAASRRRGEREAEDPG